MLLLSHVTAQAVNPHVPLTLLQVPPSLRATSALSCSRCWHCGESLLGRIPFHYLDFSFCSTACLQTHRRAQAGHT